MKGNLKKIIPTALLSVTVTFAALGIAGCSSENDADGTNVNDMFENNFDNDTYIANLSINNVFIVYNGKLHKGDVSFVGKWKYGYSIPFIKTDCGMARITNEYSISPDMPHDDEYEFVCEECIHENE